MSATHILYGGPVITLDPDHPFYENGAVVYRDGKIVEVGDSSLVEAYPDGEKRNVNGRVILPGFINAHTHIYSAYARGMGVSDPTRHFLEILDNLWWKLDKKLTLEDTIHSGYATFIESIRNGVTTVFDHHASPYDIDGSLFALRDVAKELNIRGDFCYEVSDRDGVEIMRQGIRENMAFIKACEENPHPLVNGHFGLHAAFTLSDESLEECAAAMEGHDAGYHVHTAEGIADQYDSLKKYGKRVVERLHDFNILGEKTLAIHCCNLSAREIDILRDTNTAAVHNPESNMGNAVGVTPVLQMLKKGVLLGMGTDAYTNDMLESLKVAKVLQSHHHSDPTVGFNESLTMLLENNRKIAARFFDLPIGVLKEGASADIITMDYRPYTPLNGENYGGHMIFGMYGRQTVDTIVYGKYAMKDREIVNVDEEKVFAKIKERAPKLWAQM